MKNILKQRSGYTIIELLAVVSILVVISGVISGIIYSTLRGSNKTRITTEVAQNGDYALSVISNIVLDTTSVTHIGGTEISDCTGNPTGDSIALKRLDGSSTILSCSTIDGVYTVSSNSASLINIKEVEIESSSCSFYCSQTTNDPYSIPIVGVSFKIKDKGTGLFESQSSTTFDTSVSIRSYSP